MFILKNDTDKTIRVQTNTSDTVQSSTYLDTTLSTLIDDSKLYGNITDTLRDYKTNNGQEITISYPTESPPNGSDLIREYTVTYENVEIWQLYINLDDDTLLLILDNTTHKIIGSVVSNRQELNTLELKYHISRVDINPNYRGKSICNKMLTLYIFLIEQSYPNIKSYQICLFNGGGIIACKCYIKSFKMMGYTISGNSTTCQEDFVGYYFRMIFKKTVAGGRRKTKHKRRIKRRTIKSQI